MPRVISRTIDLGADSFLRDLAAALEIAFGREYPSNFIFRFGSNVVSGEIDDAVRTGPRMKEFLRLPGERFRFEIHSDAVWQYHVEFTGLADGSVFDSPRCLLGDGAMPHDDFGGNNGFADFLSHSKSTPIDEYYREWAEEIAANGSLYYDDFDIRDINRRLQNIDDFGQ